MSRNTDPHSRPAGGELVIPVLAVAFTIYFFISIWNSPWTAKASTYLIGGILLGLCALFFLKVALELRSGAANMRVGCLISIDDLRGGRAGLFVSTLGYAVLIDSFGFTLTTFAFLFVSMTILSKGRGVAFNAGLAGAMALTGWAVFIWAFDTRFPRGWFEGFMDAVLNNG